MHRLKPDLLEMKAESSGTAKYIFNLLYKAEKPSVRLSVCPSDRHADISAVYASIETRLARNES